MLVKGATGLDVAGINVFAYALDDSLQKYLKYYWTIRCKCL